MYIAACANTTALAIRIEKSQSEYLDGIERERVKREAAREAAAALNIKTSQQRKHPKRLKLVIFG